MTLGWVNRALAPKNCVSPPLRDHVTPTEARWMRDWPIVGTTMWATFAAVVLEWRSWAVIWSSAVILSVWTWWNTRAVLRHVHQRQHHERIQP